MSDNLNPQEGNAKKKKPFYKRWWFIVFAAIIILGSFGNDSEDKQNTETTGSKQVEPSKEEKQTPLDFKADMSLQVEGESIIATVNTNAPDGAMFEVFVMNSELDIRSEFLPVKDGKIVKKFDVVGWKPGYVGGNLNFRFDLPEHKQPDDIIQVFGEKGEMMTGSQVDTNQQGYKFGTIEPETIAYPDEATVKTTQSEALVNAFNEIITASNGVIVAIQPHFTDGDWSSVAVTVSDSWYYSQKFEQERFAEQVGQTVKNMVYSSGAVPKERMVSVYFYDSYDKEVASPKMLGGYDIKE